MDEELARRVQTFRDQGFTVFSGLFDLAQVERWRAAFDGLAEQGHLVQYRGCSDTTDPAWSVALSSTRW